MLPRRRRPLAAAAILGIASFSTPLFAQDLAGESFPNKWIESFLPEKLPELKSPSYYEDVDKARQEAFSGRYKMALVSVMKINRLTPETAWIKGYALNALGRRDEALFALSDKVVADNPKVQLLRAQVLADHGHVDHAIATLREHLKKHPDSLEGHYHLGAVSEIKGDFDAARAAYEWVYKNYWDRWHGQGHREFEEAEQVTLMGRAFDRHATLSGMYANNPQLHSQVLKTFTTAYDVIDRGHWPARVAAAEYYISHGNPKEAQKELRAAMARNPNDPHALALMGYISLEQYNFDGADKALDMIRKIDDRSIEGGLLEARNYLLQRRPKEAEVAIRRVLKTQPKHVEALGVLAAVHAFQLRDDEANKVLEQIEKLDPNNHTAYFEMGEHLGAMRQYPRAEAMYRKSIERFPHNSAARNGLALLLTQAGEEDKVKPELDAAYALDPFNYRTLNYLRLNDMMTKFARKESEHFILIYDPKNDPVIPEYFLEYLESIHKSVCDSFQHEPPVKTLIEVFPTHAQFSARITGAPWIGTVGASTGRVIALSSPRRGEGQMMNPYNWAQVLRHEYTHTVTLSATDNRIGHWMTEGLAVLEERSPMRWEWVPMLYQAVTKKELFTMDNLTWGFVRPKRPQDRSLAYAQSFWICTYIAEKWSHDHLLKMMAEFKKGKTQDDVFPTVLGVSTLSFNDEFFAWAEKQVAGWGYDEETSKKYTQLVEKGEGQMRAKEYDAAIKTWEQVIEIRPVDMLPYQRLAGLYLQVKKLDKAKEMLVRLHQVSLNKNMFAKRVAKLCVEMNDLKEAEKYAIEAVYVDPYDMSAHELLLQIHEKSGNKAGIDREKRVIPVLAKWIEDYRKSTQIPDEPTTPAN
jgi:cellulose synthase operon protein C